jgi:hypothetical protein
MSFIKILIFCMALPVALSSCATKIRYDQNKENSRFEYEKALFGGNERLLVSKSALTITGNDAVLDCEKFYGDGPKIYLIHFYKPDYKNEIYQLDFSEFKALTYQSNKQYNLKLKNFKGIDDYTQKAHYLYTVPFDIITSPLQAILVAVVFIIHPVG